MHEYEKILENLDGAKSALQKMAFFKQIDNLDVEDVFTGDSWVCSVVSELDRRKPPHRPGLDAHAVENGKRPSPLRARSLDVRGLGGTAMSSDGHHALNGRNCRTVSDPSAKDRDNAISSQGPEAVLPNRPGRRTGSPLNDPEDVSARYAQKCGERRIVFRHSSRGVKGQSLPRSPSYNALSKDQYAPYVARLGQNSITGMAPSLGKRKRQGKDGPPRRPVEQQIFRDKIFFFVPSNDTNVARRMRIRKAEEYGAIWAKVWNTDVTHIIVDSGFEYEDALRCVGIQQIPEGVHMVDERYPAQCIAYNSVEDPTKPLYRVKNWQKKLPPERTIEYSSPDSLQIKQPKKARPLATPTKTTQQSSEPSPQALKQQREAYVSKLAEANLGPDTELERAISRAKELKRIPFDLEEESEDNRQADGEDESSQVKPENEDIGTTRHDARAEDVENKLGIKRKARFEWQNTFACMHGGTVEGAAASPNAATISILQKMCDHYTSNQDQWRTLAHRRAIAALRRHHKHISSYEEALKVPGVGDHIARKIEEIAATNRLRQLDGIESGKTEIEISAQLFSQIYGVGPVQAWRWAQQGLRTLEALRNANGSHDSNVSLTESQKIGLEHYDDFQQRIPRQEVEAHGAIVRTFLHSIDADFQVTIGGSYRRGATESGDIDLVITIPQSENLSYSRTAVLGTLVPRLFKSGYLTATLAAGARSKERDDGSKWHGACQLPVSSTTDNPSSKMGPQGTVETLPEMQNAKSKANPNPWRRIDLLLVPWNEVGAAMLYFTGNDIFNRSMRLLAQKKGMRLNQRGLYKDVLRRGGEKLNEGERVAGEKEEDIFELLGVPWRPPEERNC